MTWLRHYFSRRLSWWEALLVVLLVGLVGGLGYLGYNFTTSMILNAKVKAAMPAVCDALRHQRAAIVAALESYKSQFGDYPPDHVISRKPLQVDPITNTLLYELTGTLDLPARKQLQVVGLEPAEEAYVTNFFQCARIRNCSDNAQQLKQFLSKGEAGWQQLHDDPDVFVLGCEMSSAAIPSDLFWQIEPLVSSWRYVHSCPTNNPGKFDLWIEIKTKDHPVTIGNWKAAE